MQTQVVQENGAKGDEKYGSWERAHSGMKMIKRLRSLCP